MAWKPLHAAQAAFSDRTYAEVSLQEIARRADASTALIAFHFGGKRELYVECLREASRNILTGLRELPGEPSLDRLATAVRWYIDYAIQHRTGYLGDLQRRLRQPGPVT